MSGDGAGGARDDAAREQARRRRRLAEVFGDVIPEQTSDDAGDPADRGVADSNEEWLRRQVPPHHG